jgi:hypothetical protein
VGLVVTGISQTKDTSALEAALRSAGLSLEPLQVVSGDDAVENLAHRRMGSDILLGDGGSSVPGLTGRNGGGLAYFRNEPLHERLGDLEIPDSQVDNYVEALEAGRSVIAYFAKPNTLTQIEDIFRSAGLAKVTTF